VLYWLDTCEEPGDLVAEGSIHASEELMRKVKKAKRAILKPEAGPSLALKREADRNWVLCQSVANLTPSIVVSNELATIVTTDVRCLPSRIFGRAPIYDVCCEAPSPSRDARLLSSARWMFMWTDYHPCHEANMPDLQSSNVPRHRIHVHLRGLPGARPVFRRPAYR